MTKDEFLKSRQGSDARQSSPASEQTGKTSASSAGSGTLTKQEFLKLRQQGGQLPWQDESPYASLLPGYKPEKQQSSGQVFTFSGAGGKIDGGSEWRKSINVTDGNRLVEVSRMNRDEERFYRELQDERNKALSSGMNSEDWYAQRKNELKILSEENAKAQAAKQKAEVGLSAGAAAGEFGYMFEDERKAAEDNYGSATDEADKAFQALQDAKKRLSYAELFRWDDTRNGEGFQAAAEKGAASDRNKVTLAERERENILNGGYNSDVNVLMRDDYDPYFDIDPESLLAYTHMSEDEKEIYNYLLGARGEQAADEYLEDIRETLNARQGYAAAERIEQQGEGLRLVNELALAGGSGLENAVEGIGQNFSAKARKTSPTQYASQYARQNIERHSGPRLAGRSLEGVAYDATNTMANMVPSLAVGAINPIAGAATMGLQSKGNAYKQALDEGYTRGQAEIYSFATGTAEAGLQYLLGGFAKLGGIEQFTGKMTAKIGKAGLRAAAEIGIDIVGENTEEYLQNKLEPLLRNTIFGENNEIRLWDDEDTYTLILTTLTTGMMNGAEKGANVALTRNQIRSVGKSWMQQGLDTELIEKAAAMEDSSVQQLATQLQAEGHKPSARELGELAIAYEAAGGDMSFVIEHALKTDEKATDAIRKAEGQDAVPGGENTAETEIERAAAIHGKDAKVIEDMYQEGQDADEYARAMDAGINLLAAEGSNREALDRSSLTAYLTEQQKNAAWEIGHVKYENRQQRAAELSRRGSEREVSEIQRGTVSWEGATIDGVQYAAVDRSKLNSQQAQQTDACSEFAERMGIDLAFFDGGESNTKGAYRQGGKIFLNVNNSGSMGEALIVSAFSHEVTHFAEEYGGTAYEELRSYVVKTLAGNDTAKFEQLVEAKRKTRGGISYEEALSEVVADGCETMLRDTHAPERLARENQTLLRQICDWLDGWVKKIKAAFTGVEARHPEAKALMENAEALQARWDKALAEAVQNREAVRAENETTAEDGGRVQYSKEEQEEILHLKEQVKAHQNELNKMEAVADITVPKSINPFDTRGMVTWAQKILNAFKIVDVPGFGKVRIEPKRINRSFDYLPSSINKNSQAALRRAQIAAYPAIPRVLKRGVQIQEHTRHKGNQHDTVTFAAPVVINGVRGDMAVVVTITTDNFYKVHRVLTKDGELLTIDKSKEADGLPSGRPSGEEPITPNMRSASKNRIPQTETGVKTQHSERDNSVSDRELLREAAEHEGASDELKKYARKADNLEAYQRRLERQETKLKSKELSGEERAALEKRVDETKALIARTQTALTQMELRPSMQQEIQEARERWWGANMGDAVQTAREIQKENRELKEAVDYYREQAKLTGPENRRVDPADVKRFARALLKEHESSADAEKVSAVLQKLGDKLVRGDSGSLDYFELKRQADRAAKLIVDEVYKDVNAEIADELSGLSSRVREARLQISDELRGDIPDFNAWRKARLGRFTLVNEGGRSIDDFYQTLRDDYGEGHFPSSITSASGQIEQIERKLDAARPRYQYAYTEMQHDERVSLVSQEIMDTILSGEIREAETIADRNYRKMQERMLTAREAQRDAERRANAAERRADRAEETALRQAREEQREITREKITLLREELNEGREAQQKRINIERMRGRLSRLIRENSAKKHVPEALRGDIGKFLLSLDTLGPFSEGTKSEAKFKQEMQEIERALGNIMNNGELGDFYGDLELTEGVKAMLQNNIADVRAAIGGLENGKQVTRRMNLQQLRSLEETLTVLSTAVRNMNELLSDGEHRYAHMDELGEATISETREIEERKYAEGKLGRQLKWANLTPYYAFKRFGEAGQEIFRGLTRGWGKMARHIEQVQSFAENAYTAEEARSWEQKEHSFKLVPRGLKAGSESAVLSGDMDLKKDAETVTLTEAQIMSLYCLNKREQARGHLYGAGIRIGDYQIGNHRPTTQSEHYLLDLDDMATILKTLSPRQIEVCDTLVKYMNTVGSSWGNEVSMKLYGIRGFTEENYFPIRTDSTQHEAKTKDSDRGNLYRLANQSFTKQLTKNANNAIIVDSIFDVWSDHMADMAKYNAMVLPMLDAMRWYNYQAETTSVQQALQRAFGGEAGRYFMDFMQDMNGAGEGGRGEGWYSKMMSGAKVASVAANIRVALQQPTSIARASAQLNPKYLAAGAAMKGGREKALQYSGLAVWKDLGYFDVNVNRGMREQIKHADTLKDKIQEKSMTLAEKGDQLTWGALWNACELETKDKTGLSGEELMQKTAERFDEVILATQVMDSTLTRSSNMRGKNALMKEFSAFMAEPTLTYNMLLDCYSEFDKIKRSKGTAAAMSQMKGKALRTAAVYCASAALTAVAQSIGDAGRDDDDYETWLQKFTQHYTENFLDNLNPAKLVPIVSQVWGMSAKALNKLNPFRNNPKASKVWGTVFNGRDMELLGLQPVQQSLDALLIWGETVSLALGIQDKPTQTTWYGNMTDYGKIYKTLQAFSSWTGLPFGAATREFQSGYNTILRPLLNETWGRASGKELPKWRTYDGGPQRQIKSAWESGLVDDEEAKKLLISEGVAKDEIEAGKTIYGWSIDGASAYKAVKEAAVKGDVKGYKEAMKAMTSAGYTESDVKTEVRKAIKQQYQQPESGLELSKAYCIKYLQQFAGMDQADAEETAQEWTCYKVTGIAFDDIKESYVSGEIGAARAKQLRMTYGGADEKSADKTITNWTCERETGIAYDDMKSAFLDGRISDKEAIRMRMTYGGAEQKDAERTVLGWTCEKECGYAPSDLGDAYMAGDLNRRDAKRLLQKYKSMDSEAAEFELQKLDFRKQVPEAEDIKAEGIRGYQEYAVPAGISAKKYYEFWSFADNAETERDSNGKTIKGRSTQDKVVAFIDKMNISNEQKDALYLSMYTSKKLKKTPWHK